MRNSLISMLFLSSLSVSAAFAENLTPLDNNEENRCRILCEKIDNYRSFIRNDERSRKELDEFEKQADVVCNRYFESLHL